MMFPLKQRKIGGFYFGQKYPASFGSLSGSKHLGVDYAANYDDLFAPFNGRVERRDGTQGGITLWFYPDGNLPVMRFMHLSKVIKTGQVNQGDLIAVTGNTGLASSGPHLHIDISLTDQGSFWNNFNNFIDPEKWEWEEEMKPGFDLFQEEGSPEVCFRIWEGYKAIPSDQEAKIHFGDNYRQYVKIVPKGTCQPKIDDLINKPAQVVTNTVTVEKPVIIEKDILTEEEKDQFIKEYEKTHPPVFETKIEYVEKPLTQDEQTYISIGKKIKNLFVSVLQWIQRKG